MNLLYLKVTDSTTYILLGSVGKQVLLTAAGTGWRQDLHL